MTPRILVVDDEVVICDVIQRALIMRHYTTETAGSALEAIEKLEAAPYDLAIVDLMLPDVNGLEVAEAIRLLDPGTPVILITAYGTPSFENIASHPAISYYIHKPFELDRMMELVDRLISGQKKGR
jgi:DNA-binding NtrC family response regulator